MYMKKHGVIIWSLLTIAIAAFSGSRSAAALDKIKFPYSPIAWQSLPWWVAKEAKLFEKYGLDVDIFFEGASPLIVQAMFAGEAHLAGLGGPTVITNVLKGGDVIQVAAVVKTFTVPMYVHPSIKELAQLRGKKLGVSRFGAVSHLTAQAVLQRAGIKDVTIIQTGGIPESTAALSSGNVAGAMVPPPQSVLLREQGFHELIGVKQLREMNIRFVENGIVTRRSYAEKNPEIVKRFMKAAFEALRKMHDDREFSMRVIAKYTKINDQKMVDESYRFAVDAFAKDPRVPPEALEAMVEQLITLKTVDAVAAKNTPVTAYYDNRFVEELEREGFLKRLWE
jgi:taurine transport system substrate-binding protein